MNYYEFFKENAGKKVRVEMTDGEVFEGKLTVYISAADNDPEPESITVDNTELYTNEINSIKVQK